MNPLSDDLITTYFCYIFKKSNIEKIYECFTDDQIDECIFLKNSKLELTPLFKLSKIDLENSLYLCTYNGDKSLVKIGNSENTDFYKSFTLFVFKEISTISVSFIQFNFFYNSCDKSTILTIINKNHKNKGFCLSLDDKQNICNNINSYLENTLTEQLYNSSIIINRPMKQIWKKVSNPIFAFHATSFHKFEYRRNYVDGKHDEVGASTTIYDNDSNIVTTYRIFQISKTSEKMIICYEKEQNISPKRQIEFVVYKLSPVSCLVTIEFKTKMLNKENYATILIKYSQFLLRKLQETLEKQVLVAC